MRKKVHSHDHQESGQEEQELSKTQRKKEMEALQELGEKLVQLEPSSLTRFALPEELKDALLEAQHIKAHGALRRQLQYIGKLMRNVDYVSIQQQFDAFQDGSQTRKRYDRLLETWRERLLNHSSGINDFLKDYPETDEEHLKKLIEGAREEMQQAKQSPKAYRALFQFLKKIIPFSLIS